MKPLLGTPESNLVEVHKAFDDFTNGWNRLEEKHDSYTEELVAEDPADEAWINTEHERYSNQRKRYVAYTTNLEKFSKLQEAKRNRSVHLDGFNDQLLLIDKLIAVDYTIECLLREKGCLERKYEEMCAAHMKVMMLHPTDDKSEAKWQTNKYDLFFKSINSLDKFINLKKNIVTPENFRMERVGVPKFDGNVRNYSRFITDFKKLVLPNIAPEQSAFTLRQCLTPEINAHIGNDDDVTSMLKFLEIRYGDPEKLVESVIGEIQRFKRIDTIMTT